MRDVWRRSRNSECAKRLHLRLFFIAENCLLLRLLLLLHRSNKKKDICVFVHFEIKTAEKKPQGETRARTNIVQRKKFWITIFGMKCMHMSFSSSRPPSPLPLRCCGCFSVEIFKRLAYRTKLNCEHEHNQISKSLFPCVLVLCRTVVCGRGWEKIAEKEIAGGSTRMSFYIFVSSFLPPIIFFSSSFQSFVECVVKLNELVSM